MSTATHDDGFHEIQLNGKQLVFLFMAGTVVAVVIFLLGVFVGRGVRVQGGEATPIIGEGPAASEPEIPPATMTSGGAAPAPGPDVSYPRQLEGASPQEEPLRAPSATPPSAAPVTDTPSVPAPTPAPVASAPPTRASAVPGEPAGSGFAIQLAALAKRDEAEGIVRRLAAKGYAAYLMAPADGRPAMYRVRVGKFKDRREAESVSNRLQKEEQFKPWIVR